MKYVTSVFCVDGDTIKTFKSDSREQSLKFLHEHDHEGSYVQVDIGSEDVDEAYALLGSPRDTPPDTPPDTLPDTRAIRSGMKL